MPDKRFPKSRKTSYELQNYFLTSRNISRSWKLFPSLTSSLCWYSPIKIFGRISVPRNLRVLSIAEKFSVSNLSSASRSTNLCHWKTKIFEQIKRKKRWSQNLLVEFLKSVKMQLLQLSENHENHRNSEFWPKLAFLPVNQTDNYTWNRHKFFVWKNFEKCNCRILDF